MGEICPICGLPKEICVCEVLEKEEAQKIKVYVVKKKFRKFMTIIEGIEKNKLEKTVKELKHKLACGGTSKEGHIELQGDHKSKMKGLLIWLGYPEESITIV
jgi:translation initiation factor 1